MKNPVSFLFSSAPQVPNTPPPVEVEPGNIPTMHESYGYVHLPMEIDVHQLQNKLNKQIPNGPVINQPNILANSNEDNYISARLWKLSDLILSEERGMLCINMHIKVEVPMDYLNKWIGRVNLTPSFTGRLQIKTSLSFENFKLIPGLEVVQVAWYNEGATSLFTLGYTAAIKDYVTNNAIDLFKPLLARYISAYCNKETIIQELKKVCTAKEVDETHHVWYTAQPLTIYTSKLLIQQGKIAINLEMHTQLEISVGERPRLYFNGGRIQFVNYSTAPMGILEARLPIFISYLGLTEILQRKLLGKSLTADGLVEEPTRGNTILKKMMGSSLITKIRLSSVAGRITIDIGLQGGIFEGNHQLFGSPIYDASKNQISFDKVGYTLDPAVGKALQTVNLFGGIITKIIKRYAAVPLRPHIEAGIKQVNEFFEKKEELKNLVLAKVTSMSLNELALTDTAIILRFKAKGEVSILMSPQSV